VFGADSFRSEATAEAFRRPRFDHVIKESDCLSKPYQIVELDMNTIQPEDLEVRFASLRFVSFRFVSFRFVSFRFVSFRFVSFRCCLLLL
jgi:hypothetical protein